MLQQCEKAQDVGACIGPLIYVTSTQHAHRALLNTVAGVATLCTIRREPASSELVRAESARRETRLDERDLADVVASAYEAATGGGTWLEFGT